MSLKWKAAAKFWRGWANAWREDAEVYADRLEQLQAKYERDVHGRYPSDHTRTAEHFTVSGTLHRYPTLEEAEAARQRFVVDCTTTCCQCGEPIDYGKRIPAQVCRTCWEQDTAE